MNLLNQNLYHAKSTDNYKIGFEKKGFFSATLGYIEEYCTKNGFDIINLYGSNNRVYKLIKRRYFS
ncbi:MAG: hypothetical protein ACFFE4_05230 [Candidatus Thorarchaeota archaeon]